MGKKKTANSSDKVELKAFLTGNVISLKEVGDGVFSEGVVGDGLAIQPEDNILYAPAAGEICALMEDSRHACGIRLDNGIGILLHVGIDTVDMKGDGFEYLVKTGQRVKSGTPLLKFDRDKIRKAGHPDVTVCVITDIVDSQKMEFHVGQSATANDTVIATVS